MKQFDINRFWWTLRWVLGTNRRRLTMWTLGMAAGVFLFEMLMVIVNGNSGSPDVLKGMAQCLSFALYMTFILGLCSVTQGIDKRGPRTAMLMLPASNAEKYLSLVVYVSVVWPVCIFLAYVAGDLLRMGVHALMNHPTASTLPIVTDTMSPISGTDLWQEMAFMVSFMLAIHAWNLYCGTVLRRHAFIGATVVALAVISTVIYIATQVMRINIRLFSRSWEDGVYVSHVDPLVYVLIAAHLLVAIVTYRRAYRVFKDMPLISNKWTNFNIPENWKRYDILIR